MQTSQENDSRTRDDTTKFNSTMPPNEVSTPNGMGDSNNDDKLEDKNKSAAAPAEQKATKPAKGRGRIQTVDVRLGDMN